MALDADTQALLPVIGANVARLRQSKRLTQATLAEAVACEPNYLQKIEYGTATPSLQTLVRIARELGVPIGRLFRVAKPRAVKLGRPPVKKVRKKRKARR